jgi:hypothetical protein
MEDKLESIILLLAGVQPMAWATNPMHRVKPETIKHQSSIACLELQN